MKLFKSKEEKKSCCCENCSNEELSNAQPINTEDSILILGSGCAKCNALEEAVRTALQELTLDIQIEHIKDFAQIASYGVMTTPALVYQGKVLSYGKVLSVEEVKNLLSQG